MITDLSPLPFYFKGKNFYESSTSTATVTCINTSNNWIQMKTSRNLLHGSFLYLFWWFHPARFAIRVQSLKNFKLISALLDCFNFVISCDLLWQFDEIQQDPSLPFWIVLTLLLVVNY